MDVKQYLHELAERIGDFFFVRRADEKLDDTVVLDLKDLKKELHTHGIA